MQLNTFDWSIVILYFVIALAIGIAVSKRSGKNSGEFFGAGGKMPWWLLGLSMVATTFSTDTPNLVTDIVRKDGVAGNWSWWVFLLTGMLTVFIYARLWKRIGVLTDIEFYELRYSGKNATFLRGFRALYLGFFFNVVIMATVSLAAIKIGGVLLGLSPIETILIASIVTVIYSSLGGLRGVLITDLLLFVIAMIGSVATAFVAVNHPKVGGLDGLLANEAVQLKMPMMPDFSDPSAYVPLLIIPLLVQWWSVWYPGAEPGGGGYIAQRMLAAKDEKNAIGSVFLFNLAHYALRPWPWIIVALASILVYPMHIESNPKEVVMNELTIPFLEKNIDNNDVKFLQEGIVYNINKSETEADKNNYRRLEKVVNENIDAPQIQSLTYIYKAKNTDKDGLFKKVEKRTNPLEEEKLVNLHLAYPNIEMSKLNQDLAYSAMLPYLPAGLLGLVITSLIAAYMSTISTHLNWGASYIVNDWYKRFIKPESSEKELVRVGQLSTVLLMLVAGTLALFMESALDSFNILLQIGAGTGLIFILRWFWWRINAAGEIAAMAISFVIALFFELGYKYTGLPELESWQKLVIGVGLTTIGWVLVVLNTKPTDEATLLNFVKRAKPGGPGWKRLMTKANQEIIGNINEHVWKVPQGIIAMIYGSIAIYSFLMATGFWIYGDVTKGLILTGVGILTGFLLFKQWRKI